MEDVTLQDQNALQERLAQARVGLDGLVRDLHGIDAELEALSGERQKYRLLLEVCGGLDQLNDLGAAKLFWGERDPEATSERYLRVVRGRADGFEKRVAEIEDRRHELLEEIDHAQESSEFIEDDLYEIERQAEQRKREWIIEREVTTLATRGSVMPWARGGEDDILFRKALGVALLFCLVLGLIFPYIDLPIPESWAAAEVPERLTRLIKEERPLPPEPPVQKEVQVAELKPEVSEEPATVEKTPRPKAQAAKPDMASKGILAFREKFSGLAESKPAARIGAKARIRDSAGATNARSTRSLVSTQAQASSGGIDVGTLSRDTGTGGDGQIEGVQVARATSAIGTVGGSDRPLSGGGPGLGRSDEEIQIVFDRHKGALYRLYNRELRRDPTLKGQMVLRITIEPDGSVSLCELKSTDMKAPKLATQVLGRVRTFDFGAKDGIPAITILYPIDFLPAT